MKTPSNYIDKTCANSLKSQTAGDAAGGPNFLRPITIWHPPEFTTYKPFMPLKFNIIQHFNPMKFHKIPYEIPRNPRVWSHWISEPHHLSELGMARYTCYMAATAVACTVVCQAANEAPKPLKIWWESWDFMVILWNFMGFHGISCNFGI